MKTWQFENFRTTIIHSYSMRVIKQRKLFVNQS